MSRIRRHLTSAHAIAVLALIVALSGTAVAAGTLITGAGVKNGSLTGLDIKKSSLNGTHIKDSSLTSTDVKNGSLLADDFKAGQLPAGAKGDTGATGATGPAGPITGTLPTGTTIRGMIGTALSMANTEILHVPLSLPLSMTSGPNYHVIGVGGIAVGSDPACTGTVANPQAASGHVCVYLQSVANGTVTNMGNPEDGFSVSNGAVGSKFGVSLVVTASSTAIVGPRGTWAATGN